MEKQRVYGIAALLGLACLLGGIYAGYTTLFTDLTEADTEVEATIVESHLEKNDPVSTSGESEGWYVVVTYQYEYNGTTYNSSRWGPGTDVQPFYEDEQKAQQTLQTNYSEGSNITAYVAADNPQLARLKGARHAERLLGAGVMLVVGFFATLFMGSAYLVERLHPDPDEVSPDMYELREQFEDAFTEVEYPVADATEAKRGQLDNGHTFESNDLSFTVREMDNYVESEPEAPLENAEQLTEYMISEMEKQGYFEY